MADHPAAFDGLAPSYDTQFTHTLSGMAQRAATHAYIRTRLSSTAMRILELNCGTGEDAAWLGILGHQVLATDISAGMVAIAQDKCAPFPNVTVQQADIATALAHPGGPWDLIISNFGGLNCLSLPDLRALSLPLRTALTPQGHFIAVVMPRTCLWETTYFLSKFRFKAAFRRFKGGPVQAPLQDGSQQTTWYHSPSNLQHAWHTHLQPQALRPIGFFLPPSYLDPLVRRNPRLWTWLQRQEPKFAASAWPAPLSDHFLIDFSPRQ